MGHDTEVAAFESIECIQIVTHLRLQKSSGILEDFRRSEVTI